MISVEPVVCGIYLLFRERRLAYVGRSHNCYQRINQHRINGREFEFALICPCAEADAPWIETALIRQAQPPGNIKGTTRPEGTLPDLVVVPATPLPAPSPPAPSYWQPDDLVSKTHARRLANDAGLSGAQIDKAIESGEIRSALDTSRNTGRGPARLMLYGDVADWITRERAARLKRLGLKRQTSGAARVKAYRQRQRDAGLPDATRREREGLAS